jgi:hypothetical protein
VQRRRRLASSSNNPSDANKLIPTPMAVSVTEMEVGCYDVGVWRAAPRLLSTTTCRSVETKASFGWQAGNAVREGCAPKQIAVWIAKAGGIAEPVY